MVFKRGLSDIVTSVLIILLVLVAVGIIWAFLRPTITDSASQLQGVTTTYGSLLSIDARSITVDEPTTALSFVVERGRGEGEMIGLKIVVEDTLANAKVFEDSSVLAPLETKRINVNYGNAGLTGRPSKVSVVPVFSIGGSEERLGSVSEIIVIPATAGSGGVCGNNDVEVGEACDDGDTTSGDGCSSSCIVEGGWQCSGDPSVCTTICGDGLVRGSEACDDGDTSGGDGCSSSCIVEGGWSCGGEPSICIQLLCGNTVIDTSEDCDDSAVPPFRPAADVCTEVAASGGFGNYYGGTLRCYDPETTNECRFDVSGCTGYCGNTIIESGSNEECDRSLFARTCAGIVVPGANERGHYYSGTFKSSDCTISTCLNTYAFGGCADSGGWCGDGIIQSAYGEECDGTLGCSPICTSDAVVPSQCSDGLDNDGDGWIDFKGIRAQFTQFGDPGCTSGADNNEANTGGAIACANGADDDGDGKKDGQDFGCLTNTDNSESVV